MKISKCPDCNKSFKWSDEIPNIGDIKGYISKTHKCECGKEIYNFKPHAKEKIEIWESIRPEKESK